MIIHSFTYSITEQRVANYSQAGPLPVLVNKTLLEHSHAYSFTHCLWFLPHYSGRVEGSTQRLYGLKSLKYYLDLCRKSFLTPALDEQSLNVLTVRCSGMPASTQLCVRHIQTVFQGPIQLPHQGSFFVYSQLTFSSSSSKLP